MRCHVNAIPHDGFWRLGRHWPCAGLEVDLNERELAVVRGEPKLRVVMLEPPSCPKCTAERPCSLEPETQPERTPEPETQPRSEHNKGKRR
jgi:hypothetical protein